MEQKDVWKLNAEVMRRYADGAIAAADQLVALMQDTNAPPSVRLGAAKAMIEGYDEALKRTEDDIKAEDWENSFGYLNIDWTSLDKTGTPPPPRPKRRR